MVGEYLSLLLIKKIETGYEWDLTISLAEVLTIAGAIVAFAIAIEQYRKSQKWRRTEFVLTYYETALNDFDAKRGTRMLDWNSVDILLKEGEIPGKTFFNFDDSLLRSALRNHSEMPDEDGFTDEEAVIRFIMDEFLDKLGLCYPFIKTGLLKKEDVEGYCSYWIDIIANAENTSKDRETRKQLCEYIVIYKFENVINLCRLFGYDINKINEE